MTQRERESLVDDPDAGSFLFDDDAPEQPHRLTRADRRNTDQARRKRKSRRGLLFVLLTIGIVAAVAAVVVPRVIDYFTVADYSGTGTTAVTVTVPSGASVSDIGGVLKKADVVKSSEAFTDAASDNSKAESIQPGNYRMRKHMSGSAALNLLLDPTTRIAELDALVTEGATSLDVAARLQKCFGADQAKAIDTAIHSSAALSVPVTYQVNGKFPTTSEGFLYPATYNCDPSSKPEDLLTAMVTRFVQQDRETAFATAAKKVGLTPYQALIVASIAQSEAKYADDMAKVVRTVLNRIDKTQPLQFDSTSSYACKIAGTPASKCIYHQVISPYNTYTHQGLPPTPIDNPGAEAMYAATHPAKGKWLYFVGISKNGRLGFYNTDTEFAKAKQKCIKLKLGCG